MTTGDAGSGLFCPVCGFEAAAFAPTPQGRADARCPRCSALERHRFLGYLLASMTRLTRARVVLDIAPTTHVRRFIEALTPAAVHVGVDRFEPDRDIDLVADLTATPLASGCADLILCYHVLEHIPDDRAAMRELARLLSPDGVALVQVPWFPNRSVTDEEPAADAEERVRRFGQADHVRKYGRDFVDRLREAGLDVDAVTAGEVLGPGDLARIAVPATEPVWIARSTPSPGLADRAPFGLPPVDEIMARARRDALWDRPRPRGRRSALARYVRAARRSALRGRSRVLRGRGAGAPQETPAAGRRSRPDPEAREP